MRFKWFVPPILTVSFFAAALPVFSQVAPAYSAPGIPWIVGAGPSTWDVDWGYGRMIGITAWADWYPVRVENWTHIRGLGAEFEFRDVSWGQNLPAQKNQRQFNYLAGPIFNWHLTHRFHPYIKGDFGYGVIDFYPLPGYSSDSRTILAPGGGFEFRFWGPLSIRGDYEYQLWEGKLLSNIDNPQGITAGISYDLSHPQGR